MLEALAVFRRPITALEVEYLLVPFFAGIQVPGILRRLVRSSIIHVDRANKTITLTQSIRTMRIASYRTMLTMRWVTPVNRSSSTLLSIAQVSGSHLTSGIPWSTWNHSSTSLIIS